MFSFFSPCSTVAASINALATVTFEDFVKSCFPHLSDKLSTWISKGLCRYSRWIFYSISWNERVVRVKSCTHYSGHSDRHKCMWRYTRNLTCQFLHFWRHQEGTRKEWPVSLAFTNLTFDILLCSSYALDSSHQHLLIMPCIDPV